MWSGLFVITYSYAALDLRVTRKVRFGEHMSLDVSAYSFDVPLWSISDIVKLADNPKYARRDED